MIRPGKRLNRAHGWVDEVRGEATEVGARRIEAGVARGERRGERRRLYSAWLVSSSSRKKKVRGNEVEHREGISTSPRRDRGVIADAWRKLADDDSRRYGIGEYSGEHRRSTVNTINFDRFLLVFDHPKLKL